MKLVLSCAVMALAIFFCTGSILPQKTRKMDPMIENILKTVPKEVILAEMRKWLDPNAQSSMDDSLKKFLDSLRSKFPVGLPEYGIPPLDPFFAEQFVFNISQEKIQVAGTFNNVNVTKLATYSIDYVKLNVFSLSVAVNFSIPMITGKGHYDINGEIIDLLPIYGNGDFQLDVVNFKASIDIKAGTNDGFVFIKSLDLGFSIDKLASHFEGLLGGGDQGDLANSLISDLAPDVLNEYEPDITNMLSDKIVGMANQALQNTTLSDLIHMITG